MTFIESLLLRRGLLELVIANVALANGFIGEQLFTILVLMAVLTTFLTPMFLKSAYARMEASNVPVESS